MAVVRGVLRGVVLEMVVGGRPHQAGWNGSRRHHRRPGAAIIGRIARPTGRIRPPPARGGGIAIACGLIGIKRKKHRFSTKIFLV